eukprot:scaffold541464_cov46-Prasinocladus_malaysianus.AAC.1
MQILRDRTTVSGYHVTNDISPSDGLSYTVLSPAAAISEVGMSSLVSMPLIVRPCSVSGRSAHGASCRARLASLSARAPSGSRLCLPSHRELKRGITCHAEDSKKDIAAEAPEAEIVEDSEGVDANGSETSDAAAETPKEPEASGYAMLLADLKAAIEGGEDTELNVAKANAKTQEATALAAREQYLRSTADFQNFRKRSQAEKDALRDQVKGDVVGDFLPLVDNFELASKQLKLETEAEKKIDSAYQ